MKHIERLLKQHRDKILAEEQHPTIHNIMKLTDNYTLSDCHYPPKYETVLLDWQIHHKIAEDYSTILQTKLDQSFRDANEIYWR